MSHLKRWGEGGQIEVGGRLYNQVKVPDKGAIGCSCGIASDFDVCAERLCKHQIYAKREVHEAGGQRIGQSVVLNLTSGETPGHEP